MKNNNLGLRPWLYIYTSSIEYMSEYTIRDSPGMIGLLSYPNKVLHNTPPYPTISVITHNPESLGFQDYMFHTSVGWIFSIQR